MLNEICSDFDRNLARAFQRAYIATVFNINSSKTRIDVEKTSEAATMDCAVLMLRGEKPSDADKSLLIEYHEKFLPVFERIIEINAQENNSGSLFDLFKKQTDVRFLKVKCAEFEKSEDCILEFETIPSLCGSDYDFDTSTFGKYHDQFFEQSALRVTDDELNQASLMYTIADCIVGFVPCN